MRRRYYDEGRDESAIIFGNALSVAMTDKGLSPEDFEEFEICSAGQISGYLRYDHVPSLKTAARIADFLGVSLDWLCGRDSEPKLSRLSMTLDGTAKSPFTEPERKAPWL